MAYKTKTMKIFLAAVFELNDEQIPDYAIFNFNEKVPSSLSDSFIGTVKIKTPLMMWGTIQDRIDYENELTLKTAKEQGLIK